MIDRRPLAIVRCRDARDVAAGIRYARDHDLVLSVRGGGHGVAGNAVCDGGIMLDLSGMKDVTVDPAQRIAHAGPGLLLGELDAATQRHGLATPLGVMSGTGIAGLTLGGGLGWLNARYGLACDNLIGARGRHRRRRHPARSGRTNTPTCCGGCAAAAATSPWSRRSSTGCTRSPRCSRVR